MKAFSCLNGLLLGLCCTASVSAFSTSTSYRKGGPGLSTRSIIGGNHAEILTWNSSRTCTKGMKKSFRQSSKLGVSTEALVEEGEATSHMFEGPFKGIARDYRKRLPFYKSDITDGLNSQCVAATMFLFFACLAPAVGFGALYYTATGGAIGTMEMVTSTAFSGILYALTSAQPLTIIGSTGPVLAFVATLYKFTARTGLPFLPVYAWTGLWTAAILFLSAITSASNLVKYLTRFTDEIFSCLISTIFIIEAVSDVARTFATPAVPFVTALLTLLCAATTYGLSTTFKNVRNTAYGNKTLRDTVSNFGPTSAVICSCLIARAAKLGQGVSLPSLAIPASFATTSGRPWLVPLNSIPVWARFASFVPALMATVLLYLDQNITVRLVNNPRFKMEKGREKNNMIDGMHADMLIISIVTALTSITGLPWLVAATVRSVSHVRAVSVFNKEGKSEKIFEQRLTGLGIHSLIGACILFNGPRSLMSHIVLPSLMGLFMYLGISSLPGVQMWERFKELFKDRSIAKDQPWSGLKRRKVNLFTLVQVASLYAMFWVKGSSIGVLFPILIAALAPFRIALERLGLFSKEEMNVLDSDE